MTMQGIAARHFRTIRNKNNQKLQVFASCHYLSQHVSPNLGLSLYSYGSLSLSLSLSLSPDPQIGQEIFAISGFGSRSLVCESACAGKVEEECVPGIHSEDIVYLAETRTANPSFRLLNHFGRLANRPILLRRVAMWCYLSVIYIRAA